MLIVLRDLVLLHVTSLIGIWFHIQIQKNILIWRWTLDPDVKRILKKKKTKELSIKLSKLYWKIRIVITRQANTLQTDFETCLDILYLVLWLCNKMGHIIQHIQNEVLQIIVIHHDAFRVLIKNWHCG